MRAPGSVRRRMSSPKRRKHGVTIHKQTIMLEVNGKQFKATLDKNSIRSLEFSKLFFSHLPDVRRLREGDILSGRMDCMIEPYACIPAGYAFPFRLGFCSYSRSPFVADMSIGRYCSIGRNVGIIGPNHPTDRISTHIFTYQANVSVLQAAYDDFSPGRSRKAPLLVPFKALSMPVIENDVWIGQDVTLARGIRIGTGAVVAGGSIVVKDVPEYGIVGGNPAKLIRYRFDDEICSELLRSEWWAYKFTDFEGLDLCEPRAFLDGLYRRIESGSIEKFLPSAINPYELLKNCGQPESTKLLRSDSA